MLAVGTVACVVLLHMPAVPRTAVAASRSSSARLMATESWGGALSTETSAAVAAVQRAVQLSQDLAVEGISGATVGEATRAADFAIIGMTSGLLHEQFRNVRFSGQKGAAGLRDDPKICALALKLSGEYSQGARQASLDLNLDMPRNLMDEGQRNSGLVSREAFLAAVDRGLEPSRGQGERCWVLDAKAGKDYYIGLALLDANGDALVGVVGAPPDNEAPPIVASVRGHVQKWWNAAGDAPVECSLPAPCWAGTETPPWFSSLFSAEIKS